MNRFCFYHWQRIQEKVPATHITQGTPMCGNCFAGKPILPAVEMVGENTNPPGRSGRPSVPIEIIEKIKHGFEEELTQAEIAEKCGVSRGLVSLVWRGKHKFSVAA